ncbi:putative amidase [Gordonia soli NBRC 108243]|uniref:Putative amidase n=1 Tax=Gordonia soli NBRC 108243 TaxID=1223545 RepID=M0QNQ7_9ACTN|nr:putative amidase [Gordonia soli NBRC 108243]
MTSIELTDLAISAIEQGDGLINAICVPDFERARAAARAADLARADGADHPLLGIPVTVKESYNISGMPTTWGMPQYRDFVPTDDAVQVARLKAAGAVVLGKTNVPLGLQDLQTFNQIYGTTNNPWNLERTSGGSSGGSAAALACGFGALSIGSDMGGSLRTPAHFCGIYAHKPTLGLAAMRGMTPPPEAALPIEADLAVVGPMARTARDLTLLLDVMAGPDPLTFGVAHEVTLPPARYRTLGDFRVLVLDDHPCITTGASVRAAVHRVADVLTAGGARVEHRTPLLPDLAEAGRLYAQLMFSGATARFPVETYEQLTRRAAELSPDDDSLTAARWRAMVCTHRDWMVADRCREIHRQAWRTLFDEFDVVVCPITPTPAFPHHHDLDLLGRRIDVDGVEFPFFDQLVWAGLATMPGLPATAIPTGPSAEGLPVGVQLVGPLFGDRTTIRLAELLEDQLGGFLPPPR